MKSTDLILGIDGGGTKTTAWLASAGAAEQDEVLGRGLAGPSNLRSVGLTLTIENLDRSVEAAFADARRDRCRVASACLGLAGVDRDDDRAAIEQWANAIGLATRTVVVHDAVLALYGGTSDGCGVALVCGTGSLAFGQNKVGNTARSGGWGHLFGDEGSGYAIALCGLRAAARAADGRGPTTSLLDRFLARLELTSPSQLISTIYSHAVERKAIASHAKLIFEASQQGDHVAASILEDAARDLAEMVASVARQLDLRNPVSLVTTGGVLLNQSQFRDSLRDPISQFGIDADPMTLVTDSVVGALRLAGIQLPRRDDLARDD